MHRSGLRLFAVVTLGCLCPDWASGQTLKLRPAGSRRRIPRLRDRPRRPVRMPICVPEGTPIKWRSIPRYGLKRLGRRFMPTIDAVYGFDKLLIPAGTRPMGRSWRSTALRKRQDAGGDQCGLSPPRNVEVRFDGW